MQSSVPTTLVTAVITLTAVLLPLAACSSRPSALAGEPVVVEPGLEGSWVTTEGEIIRVERNWPADTYTLTLSTAEGRQKLPARLADINNTRILEVLANTPTGDEAPVYHYSRLSIGKDQLINEPLNPEWLAKQVGTEPGVQAASTRTGSFVAAVRDPALMRTLLAKASTSPGAWMKPERLSRVIGRN